MASASSDLPIPHRIATSSPRASGSGAGGRTAPAARDRDGQDAAETGLRDHGSAGPDAHARVDGESDRTRDGGESKNSNTADDMSGTIEGEESRDPPPPTTDTPNASFLEQLWSSVFTPGASSALVIAANAAFAGLQLVLFLLLVGTRSVHFVVLSALCAGLWWGVNWFVTELAVVQKEKEKEEQGVAETTGASVGKGVRRRAARRSLRSEGEEDETETEEAGDGRSLRSGTGETGKQRGPLGESAPALESDSSLAESRSRLSMSGGEMSTDSEWEKVDE